MLAESTGAFAVVVAAVVATAADVPSPTLFPFSSPIEHALISHPLFLIPLAFQKRQKLLEQGADAQAVEQQLQPKLARRFKQRQLAAGDSD